MIRLCNSGPAARSEKFTQEVTSVYELNEMVLEYEVVQTKEGDPPLKKQYSVVNILGLSARMKPALVLPLSWMRKLK
jgi:hypothetical protein